MKKTEFKLEQPEFSDSDDENNIQSMFSLYDKEYSLIYGEVKNFLNQCKQNIQKYLQFNQFGAPFNLCSLYTHITDIQTSTLSSLSDGSKQQLQHYKHLKIKYEKQFEQILDKMQQVLKDFIHFQIDFKKEYFGCKIKSSQVYQPQKALLGQAKSLLIQNLSRQNSVNSGSFMKRTRKPSIEGEADQKKETELQQKLREILKKKLMPQKQNIIKFCNHESDPFNNMLKLQQKIEMMQSEMILAKTREEKMIEIFNKRRIENIQPNQVQKQTELMDENRESNLTDIRADILKQCKSSNNLSLNTEEIDNKNVMTFQNKSPQNVLTSNSRIYIGSPKRFNSPTNSFKNIHNFTDILGKKHQFKKIIGSKSPDSDFTIKKDLQQCSLQQRIPQPSQLQINVNQRILNSNREKFLLMKKKTSQNCLNTTDISSLIL